MPRHVAIIMDGNRRWARAARRARGAGPRRGRRGHPARSSSVPRSVASRCSPSTPSAARTGRAARPRCETLFALLDAAIRDETPDLVRQGVARPAARPARRAARRDPRVDRGGPRGDRRRRSHDAQRRLQLLGALGDRRRRARLPAPTGIAPDDVDEAAIAARLYTADLPDLDLLIRTGGDQRISNFLLWQAAYAELYFCDRFWPDFGPADSTRRSPSTPAAPAASAARECSVQQRLISAAVLVPVVVVVFLLGQPWLTLGIAVVAGLAALRGLPAAARGGLRRRAAAWCRGRRRSPCSACGWLAADSAGWTLASCRAGVLVVAAHRRLPATRRPRRLPGLAGHGLRRALRRRCSRSSRRILAIAPTMPADGPAGAMARRRPGAGCSCCVLTRLGVRHLRVPVGPDVQAGPVHEPHLAQQDVERRHRRHRRRHRRGRHARSGPPGGGPIGGDRARACSSPSPPRPATSPSRCSSARPAPRTRAPSSRATAASSTGSTRSCSRRPSCSVPRTSAWWRSAPCALTAPIRVALLGSTGSIGRQALDVLAALGPTRSRSWPWPPAATSRRSRSRSRRSGRASCAGRRSGAAARLELPAGTALDRGPGRVLERCATRDDVDLVVVATGGVVSLRPVLAALRAGKVVATANKETLVAGGHLVMPLAPRSRPPRSAPPTRPTRWRRRWPGCGPSTPSTRRIWQCLAGERSSDVARLILTASGGPFRTGPPSASRRPRPRTPWRTRPGAWAPRSPSTRRRS